MTRDDSSRLVVVRAVELLTVRGREHMLADAVEERVLAQQLMLAHLRGGKTESSPRGRSRRRPSPSSPSSSRCARARMARCVCVCVAGEARVSHSILIFVVARTSFRGSTSSAIDRVLIVASSSSRRGGERDARTDGASCLPKTGTDRSSSVTLVRHAPT